jgi:S1-C subfamily serine protease
MGFRLTVRFRGIPLAKLDLDDAGAARHTIGRSQDNDISYGHRALSRKQGVLSFIDGKWMFTIETRPLRSGFKESYEISDGKVVALPNGLEFVPGHLMENEETRFVSTSSMGWQRRAVLACAALGAVAILGGIGYLGRSFLGGSMDSNHLMKFAASKVVRFEFVKNQKAHEALKADAGLKDADFKETVGFCTGFLVEKNVVLTASHCFFGDALITVTSDFLLRAQDGKEFRAKRILGFDVRNDYLYLETEGMENYGKLEFAKGWELGQKVFTIGNVEGDGLAIREGIVSGETEDPNNPDVKYLRYSAGASPGNSGGPLLNGRGEVAALVFARNLSENYNLGIEIHPLSDGFHRFVESRAEKEIVVDSKSVMNFTPSYSPLDLLISLGVMPPEILEKKPELSRGLADIQFKLKLPDTPEAMATAVVQGLNTAVESQLDSVMEKVSKAGLPGMDWKSQTTPEIGLIAPLSSSSYSENLFSLDAGKMNPIDVYTLSPTTFSGHMDFVSQWKKNKDYSYPSNSSSLAQLEQRVSAAKKKKVLANSPDNSDNLGLENFMGGDTYYMVADAESAEVANQAITDAILGGTGNGGIIINPESFPFLRPKGYQPFTLKAFKEGFKEVRHEEDRMGRTWVISSTSFYDVFALDTFCTPIAQGQFCLAKSALSKTAALLEAQRSNSVRYQLSSLLMGNQYFPVSAIKPGPAVGAYPGLDTSYSDFEFAVTDSGDLSVKFKNLGYEFNLGKKSEFESLNLVPALFRKENEAEGKWVALGLEAVHRKADGKHEICTLTTLFDGYNYDPGLSSFADFSWPGQIQKPGREVASVSPHGKKLPKGKAKKPEAQKIAFKIVPSEGYPGQRLAVVSYCSPLKPSESEEGGSDKKNVFSPDRYAARPLPLKMVKLP